MICDYCGSPNHKDNLYCIRCVHSLEDDEEIGIFCPDSSRPGKFIMTQKVTHSGLTIDEFCDRLQKTVKFSL